MSHTSDDYTDTEAVLSRLEPAWAKAAFGFRTGKRLGHPPGSLRTSSPLQVHRTLEARRRRFKAGDTLELLYAIKLCAEENLPLPTWVAEAFTKRMSMFGRPGAPTSLDDVFSSKNRPTSTPKKAAQSVQDWQLGVALWVAVWDVADRHRGLSPALDELLGAGNYGVEKTSATRLVKMVDKNQTELTGQQSLSQFWAKRRKQ